MAPHTPLTLDLGWCSESHKARSSAEYAEASAKDDPAEDKENSESWRLFDVAGKDDVSD